MIAFKTAAANAVLAVALGFPQLASADGFTGADVLGWSQEAQDSFFLTSVGMAAIVAMQTGRHDRMVDCINGWYWSPGGTNEPQNDSIREAMRSLPDLHPQAVIMAVIERECGPFALN